MQVEIVSTDIHISVSPGVIEILSRVMRTVTMKEEEGNEVKKHEPSHEGLWTIKSFREQDFWFLKTGLYLIFQ